jgi:transcriptional regulator with XRE-family HTH domain
MLLSNTREIGNKLLAVRKKSGLTQAELAEQAGISDRAYADIERGTVNMRVETFLHICEALHVTPDELLTERTDNLTAQQDELIARLNACSPKDRETALRLMSVFLQSVAE